ncbi:MAG: 50S ribosomal protein L21 [Candidatus Aminicenantales bacterium]
MFAIIKTGGKQYRVQEGDVLDVEKLPAEPSQRFHFSQVLLIAEGKNTLIGTPLIEKAIVQAEVLENFKHKKIIVFKKKRRKQYRRTRGHRQQLTRVKIERIIADVTALAPEEIAAIQKERVEEVASIKAEAVSPETSAEEKAEVSEQEKVAKPAKRAVAEPARAKKLRPVAQGKKSVEGKTPRPKGKKKE